MPDPREIEVALGPGVHFACVGLERGRLLRQDLRLDEADAACVPLRLVVAPHVLAVSADFFAGLLGPSVAQAADASAFWARCRLDAPAHLVTAFEGYVRSLLVQNALRPLTTPT